MAGDDDAIDELVMQRRRSSGAGAPAMELGADVLAGLADASLVHVTRMGSRVLSTAATDLARNSPIATLRGEVVDSKEGAMRGERYRMQGIRGFLVNLDEGHVLDGSQAVNPVRWVRHANEVCAVRCPIAATICTESMTKVHFYEH